MALHFTDTRSPCFQTGPGRILEEGGVEARYQRYCENHRILVEGMRSLGFQTLLDDDYCSHRLSLLSFIRIRILTLRLSIWH